MVYIRPRLASLVVRGGHGVGCGQAGLSTSALRPLAARPHGTRNAHSGYASGRLPPGAARDENGLLPLSLPMREWNPLFDLRCCYLNLVIRDL